MSALVFLDTETTGLSPDDDVWEFAAARRNEDGSAEWLHLFIEHDEKKCARLPDQFRIDHDARFPAACSGRVTSRFRAASEIAEITRGAHIVGAVPNFDTERLARLLANHGFNPPWHYHLIDVENLAVGYLAGLRAAGAGENGRDADLPSLPWDSDDLSRAVGVEPPTDERHTALGDVRWCMALYDAITAVAS